MTRAKKKIEFFFMDYNFRFMKLFYLIILSISGLKEFVLRLNLTI
jgi:hypothetical protein